MSMLAVSSIEFEAPPVMRLAGDESEAAPEAAPKAAPEADEPAAAGPARAFVEGGMLFADDGATLPAACVACGDNLGTRALPTLRGRVHYSLCREHLIALAARAVVGLAICAGAGFVFVAGGGSRLSKLAIATLLCSLGGSLVASAVPVWTWRRPGEARRLFRIHAEVRAAVERAGR